MASKVGVYTGTRNVYPQMYTSLKSLLLNTEMDKVYLMIEDDEFPYPIPENVFTINVSGQEFFHPGTPNFGSPYSYMDLLRCALGFILQDERIVVWFDIDTIINEDISELFETDMSGYFYAGAIEPSKCKGIFNYINVGVTVCNLELLRDSGKEAEEIAFLNTYEFPWPGQDAINLLCQGRIKTISSEYNGCPWVQPCVRPKILHYAAIKADEYKKHWAYRKYDQMQLPLVDKDGDHE